MSPTDIYDLAGLADTFRRNRDGHQRLYETTSREADRAYAAAWAQALHELFLCTLGEHGEPLPQYRDRPDEHPGEQV